MCRPKFNRRLSPTKSDFLTKPQLSWAGPVPQIDHTFHTSLQIEARLEGAIKGTCAHPKNYARRNDR